jgi:hypothetical protein
MMALLLPGRGRSKLTGASKMMMKAQVMVKRHGQIKELTMPENWCELKMAEGQLIREFAPIERDDIRISFFYRGHRVHREAGEAFLKVLACPEHELSAEERESIEWIIRNASEPDWFATRSMRTETVNKKMVLVFEGIWIADRIANLGLLFDTDETGTAVQEIHYTAPESEYYQYLPVAVNAIKTVVWK